MRFTYKKTTTDALSGWTCATTGNKLPAETHSIHDSRTSRTLCTLPDICGGFESGGNRAAWIVRLLNSGRTSADRIPEDASDWITSDLYAHLTK